MKKLIISHWSWKGWELTCQPFWILSKQSDETILELNGADYTPCLCTCFVSIIPAFLWYVQGQEGKYKKENDILSINLFQVAHCEGKKERTHYLTISWEDNSLQEEGSEDKLGAC